MTQPVVGVLDYGAGNLRSVQHALEYCGAEVEVVTRTGTLSRVTHLVLPGVGAMASAMGFLATTGLAGEVTKFAAAGDRPILGICLGMQLMATTGFEGGPVSGLNLIGGVVEQLPRGDKEGWDKTPRIGWLGVETLLGDHLTGSFLDTRKGDAKYYFAHGFHFIPDDSSVIRAVVSGDPSQVVAAIHHRNLHGVQFHPEKSGELGLAFLHRFVAGFDCQEDGV